MKICLVLLVSLLPGVFWAAAQPAAPSAAAVAKRAAPRLRRPGAVSESWAAATMPADTLVVRQFLAAVADTLVSDSVVVARCMCADVLLGKRDARRDTVVARLRASLYFLRAGLLMHADIVRRSRLVAFQKLPQKPPFALADSEGAYVLLDGNQPNLCLLVRNGRVAAFALSFAEGPQKARFRDYCR